jgi:hypothetical protein
MAHSWDCQRCAACCRSYQVQFSQYELRSLGGNVPDDLTEPASGQRVRMRGTSSKPVQCIALSPNLSCSVYPVRPQCCRDLSVGSDFCIEARRRHGLPVA